MALTILGWTANPAKQPQAPFGHQHFQIGTESMDFCASGVTSSISIASVNVTDGTATGNLQDSGLLVPVTASCDKLAAPCQYHKRRALVRVTSLPSFDLRVPAKTPAE